MFIDSTSESAVLINGATSLLMVLCKLSIFSHGLSYLEDLRSLKERYQMILTKGRGRQERQNMVC